MMQTTTEQRSIDRGAIEQFLFLEARLQDEHRYSEWEALWDDDALYWVPMREGADPSKEVSYIYDNRQRITSRIRQLNTGLRHAQSPQSKLRRTISNIEITGVGEYVEVEANFILVESRRPTLTVWGGRTSYVLIRHGDSFKMRRKMVLLVNCEQAIDNIAFLV